MYTLSARQTLLFTTEVLSDSHNQLIIRKKIFCHLHTAFPFHLLMPNISPLERYSFSLRHWPSFFQMPLEMIIFELVSDTGTLMYLNLESLLNSFKRNMEMLKKIEA